MQIDKTKFLFLVGALAVAPACSASCTATGTGDDDDSSGTEAGSGGQTSATAQGSGGESGTGGAGSGGEAQGTGGSGGEAAGTGGGGTGGAGACLDEEGDPEACSGECEACAVDAMIKDGVEEAITACINALDPLACVYEDVVSCVEESLAQACPDETADEDCAYLEAECGLDPAVCHEYLDGLTPEGRDAVTACDEALCDGTTSNILDCITIVVTP